MRVLRLWAVLFLSEPEAIKGERVMNCEMCAGQIAGAYWQQKRPVDRALCLDCADKDQTASPFWHGETMVFGGDGVKYRADYSPVDLT